MALPTMETRAVILDMYYGTHQADLLWMDRETNDYNITCRCGYTTTAHGLQHAYDLLQLHEAGMKYRFL